MVGFDVEHTWTQNRLQYEGLVETDALLGNVQNVTCQQMGPFCSPFYERQVEKKKT